MNREELIEQAGRIHARECSCDPKYAMSCPNMANIILRFGKPHRGGAVQPPYCHHCGEMGCEHLRAETGQP